MNKLLKRILVVVLMFAFMYTAFSFVLWDWNPSGWESKTRGLMVLYGLILSGFGVVFTEIG